MPAKGKDGFHLTLLPLLIFISENVELKINRK